MNFKTYLVGGAVRDFLLGIPCKDLDYLVLAPSFEAMRDDLLAAGCKLFVIKPEFLTIRAKHPTLGCVDFACGRADGNYTDGRRPDSVMVTTSLHEDLSRRDFTCNAMAKDVETGVIVDPWDGKRDLAAKMLRCVGEPRCRIKEDKLRAFRALRFSVTKHLIMDAALCNAIREYSLPSQFDGVSTERIREELFKMFAYDWQYSFHLLQSFGVLCQIVVNRGIWFRPTTEQH